eukprot:4195781-Alexandrium_andersonii.AAC.1
MDWMIGQRRHLQHHGRNIPQQLLRFCTWESSKGVLHWRGEVRVCAASWRVHEPVKELIALLGAQVHLYNLKHFILRAHVKDVEPHVEFRAQR